MTELVFRLYAFAHLCAKKLFRRDTLSANYRIICRPFNGFGADDSVSHIWLDFIEKSRIQDNSSFNGFHYAGYILEKSQWCLPSWIWTNAALVRLYCAIGEIELAEELCEKFMKCQQECGGWIVRNDYDADGAMPILAPNDSAYIANNAFLTLYSVTGNNIYLDVAKRCADWIIDTCREDGMVYTGYNTRDHRWEKGSIIVDVGFTAGLFANLYIKTADDKYLGYLEKFVRNYIRLFYNPDFIGFATSIDKHDNQQGGFFGRGQAWALEGLIPAYRVLKNETLKDIIELTVRNIVKRQNTDGSWSYNLSRKLMGNDCKGVSVLAKSLADWYLISGDDDILLSVKKAYDWCRKHTAINDEACGGIFSFCTEGAVVKDLYSSCAFVYASAYAIEIEKFLTSVNAI
ncbi:MAG: hypothetical protein HDS60_00110 [Barnesiella sp.]|nr:hypothetical protein [Barnesiella sp.]